MEPNLSQDARLQLRQATQQVQTASVHVENALNAPISQQIVQFDLVRQQLHESFTSMDQALATLREQAETIRSKALQARL